MKLDINNNEISDFSIQIVNMTIIIRFDKMSKMTCSACCYVFELTVEKNVRHLFKY